MGLDVTSYSKLGALLAPLNPIAGKDRASDDLQWDAVDGLRDEDGNVAVWTLSDFLDALDLADGTRLAEGVYDVSGSAVEGCSQSYGGYNLFRELVSRSQLELEPRAVWGRWASRRAPPFARLVHFADNEGCIGPWWCSRLACDFADRKHRAKFERHVASSQAVNDARHWTRKWDEWAKVFSNAARGVVEFH